MPNNPQARKRWPEPEPHPFPDAPVETPFAKKSWLIRSHSVPGRPSPGIVRKLFPGHPEHIRRKFPLKKTALVTRLLIPIWCYIVIFFSLLWIGKPYLYRDLVNKICSKPFWWTPLCLGGMAYGAAILLCAILWW